VLRLRIRPALLEQPLEVAEHGTFDLRVHVVPAAAAPSFRGVVVAQVHPATEGDAAVDDQELAVVADLPAPAPSPGTDGMEDREPDAGGPHLRDVIAGEAERSGAVDHAAHPHALLGLDADRVDEAAPVGIARPDVHFEQDPAAGEG